jgi:MtN3 and saliva related transmembrane protein
MSFSLQRNYEMEHKYHATKPKGLYDINTQNIKIVAIDPKYIYIIGLIAGTCSSIAFFPQVIKAYKNKEATTITWITLLLAIVGQSLWLTYGTLNKDSVIRIFAGITICMYILLSLTKFIFTTKDKSNCPPCPNY